jgi:predicted regulator of Ras-like GTPase activity (Roadblock/LC7/MglB family)
MSSIGQVLSLSHEKEEIDAILDDVIGKTGALCTVLITKDGHSIAARGHTSFLNITALAALVAGSFAATKQVATLLGEKEFSILFQQGESRHIHISLVASSAMMIVVFEDSSRIGLVRLHGRRAGEQLTKIVQRERRVREKDDLMVEEFKEFAVNLIDRIFSE